MAKKTASDDLREVGLKATLPRIRILEKMRASGTHHLSAEQVYLHLTEGGDHIGLATVYRVLSQFEDAGLVLRHNLDSGADLFELAQGSHHDHIVCSTCGQVFEFHDAEIERRQRQAVADLGLRLTGHAHYLYAECEKKRCIYRNE